MRTRKIILTGLFAALTAIGAFIRIPTPISSFTLQVFFTCMAGLLLGPGLGAASQAVYVLLGLVGLPIFDARRRLFLCHTADVRLPVGIDSGSLHNRDNRAAQDHVILVAAAGLPGRDGGGLCHWFAVYALHPAVLSE